MQVCSAEQAVVSLFVGRVDWKETERRKIEKSKKKEKAKEERRAGSEHEEKEVNEKEIMMMLA